MKLRAVFLSFAFAFAALTAQAQGPGGPPPGAGETVSSLAEKLAALTARVAKLEGQITASDLVGTYALHGFQTELRAKVQDGVTVVSSYVFQGTMVLNANGTGSIGGGTQLGHWLALFIPSSPQIWPSRTFINESGVGPSFTWSYANGVVSISPGGGFPASVTAGGRVLVAAGANPADGTNVLLIMTRLQ